MKLELLDEDSYKIFINNSYIKEFNINNSEELSKYIKSIILKIRKIYDVILEGFYEVHVYIIKCLGIILEIKNIDSYLGKTVDLKIIIHNDEEIYLKVQNIKDINKYKHLKYLNNYFYINSGDIVDEENYSLFEDYKIIYGDDLKSLKRKWYNLTT